MQCVSSYDKNPFATEGWKYLQVNMYGAANAARKRSAEQTAQQGDQGDTDEGNAAASHQLLHTLTLCICVIKK